MAVQQLLEEQLLPHGCFTELSDTKRPYLIYFDIPSWLTDTANFSQLLQLCMPDRNIHAAAS